MKIRTLFSPAAALLLCATAAFAQGGRGRGGGGAPATAKAAAPIDLTGYWVSLVTEDWRFRMVTPPKGDYASVPINAEGRRVADAWDPDKDIASGNSCKAYGAAALMRVPGRLHIDWADDNTLRIDTDAGTQTRLFHFGSAQPGGLLTSTAPVPASPQLQGYSVAIWEMAGGGRGGRGGGGGFGGAPAPRGGSLKVVTTHLSPGYLRKNGVPYSGNTVLTEYYDRTNETDGISYLIITTIVEDPQYLTGQFITSTHFKKEADGSKFSPSACAAK
ncbi:MAG TPA: hypothetical protein VKV74_18845 [Bryobacteraceae bacterium]|nr:hypothetical protein [Bryobacteraceae bacterium]